MIHKRAYIIFISTVIILTQALSQCNETDSLVAAQDYLSAIEVLDVCLRKHPEDNHIRSKSGLCSYLLADYQKARQHYHTLEKDSIYRHEAVSKLAVIYEVQQNLPKAIKYYIALRELNPGNPGYLRKLGQLYLQGNEPNQALQSYKEALLLNPSDQLTVLGLGDMLLNMDSLLIADSIVGKSLIQDSLHIGLLLLHARIRYRLRDYTYTVRTLLRVYDMTDMNNYYHKLLGYALMQTDSIDKAIYHLQRSLLNENNPEYALYYLGLAYEKKRDFERSDYYYKEALRAAISDNISHYHQGLARNATNVHQLKKAIHHYSETLRYTEDPEILFYLGSLSEQYFKDKTKAIIWYEKYLKNKNSSEQNKTIAKQRIRYLNEQKFMSNKNRN